MFATTSNSNSYFILIQVLVFMCPLSDSTPLPDDRTAVHPVESSPGRETFPIVGTKYESDATGPPHKWRPLFRTPFFANQKVDPFAIRSKRRNSGSQQVGVDLSMLGSGHPSKPASSSYGFSLSSLSSSPSHHVVDGKDQSHRIGNPEIMLSGQSVTSDADDPENLMLLDISSLRPDSFRPDPSDSSLLDLDAFTGFHIPFMMADGAPGKHPSFLQTNAIPDTSTYYYDPEMNDVSVLPDWPADANLDYYPVWRDFQLGHPVGSSTTGGGGRRGSRALHGSDGGDALSDFLQGHMTDPEAPLVFYRNRMDKRRTEDGRIDGAKHRKGGFGVRVPLSGNRSGGWDRSSKGRKAESEKRRHPVQDDARKREQSEISAGPES